MISVIIPAYNEENSIEECIESIRHQEYRDYEIIVVDNNSTDQTGAIARSMGVTVITEPQKGVAHARRTGWKHAHGDTLAFTDADCIVGENWLSTIAQTFTDARIIALSGRVYFIDKNQREFSYHDTLYWKRIHPFFHSIGRPMFWGANFSVRKQALQETYFATHLNSYSDFVLGRRLQRHKSLRQKIVFDPQCKVFTYDTPSVVPKRNWVDHLLAEFGIFRQKTRH